MSLTEFKQLLSTGLETAATEANDAEERGEDVKHEERVTYIGSDNQVHEVSMSEVGQLLVSGELDGSTQIASSPRGPEQDGRDGEV